MDELEAPGDEFGPCSPPPPPPLAMVREWSLFMPEVSTEEKGLGNFLFEQILWLGEVF